MTEEASVATSNEQFSLQARLQNNWNTFACDVSEKLLLETSKLLVDYGLKDLGYQYVVLDDCWSVGRGEDGYLIPDTTKFPHGMDGVADELHKQGFLFGMYSSAGEMTCARYSKSCEACGRPRRA